MSGCVTYPLLGRNGRLGNCAFQIAATIGYAGENGKMYAFPEWEYAKYFKNFPQGSVPKEYKSLKESGFHYEPLPFVDGDVGLDGYFQNEKYFKKFEGTVRSALEFTDDVKEKAQAIVHSPFQNQRSVAVHFRFGDYVGNSFYCQLWETNYYEKALWHINRTIGPAEIQCKYYVFSDDTKRAIEVMSKFKSPPLLGDVTYIYGNSDIIDLAAMSFCDKIIMANSSFSWWGAYLGKKKQVIAPKEWFSESAGLNTKDLYCEGWMVI